jgi:hypothetical protein
MTKRGEWFEPLYDTQNGNDSSSSNSSHPHIGEVIQFEAQTLAQLRLCATRFVESMQPVFQRLVDMHEKRELHYVDHHRRHPFYGHHYLYLSFIAALFIVPTGIHRQAVVYYSTWRFVLVGLRIL